MYCTIILNIILKVPPKTNVTCNAVVHRTLLYMNGHNFNCNIFRWITIIHITPATRIGNVVNSFYGLWFRASSNIQIKRPTRCNNQL
jgi:hypothetical protein